MLGRVQKNIKCVEDNYFQHKTKLKIIFLNQLFKGDYFLMFVFKKLERWLPFPPLATPMFWLHFLNSWEAVICDSSHEHIN